MICFHGGHPLVLSIAGGQHGVHVHQQIRFINKPHGCGSKTCTPGEHPFVSICDQARLRWVVQSICWFDNIDNCHMRVQRGSTITCLVWWHLDVQLPSLNAMLRNMKVPLYVRSPSKRWNACNTQMFFHLWNPHPWPTSSDFTISDLNQKPWTCLAVPSHDGLWRWFAVACDQAWPTYNVLHGHGTSLHPNHHWQVSTIKPSSTII